MTSHPWISWEMTKPQAQEKKIEHLPNGKRCQEKNVAAHSVHTDLTVHICGIIQKIHKLS